MELLNDYVLTLLGSWGWAASLVLAAIYAALVSAALAAAYLLARLVMPKIAAVAWTTAKEALLQPLFALVAILGVFALVISIYLPYNTFGEDIKMFKVNSLMVLLVASMTLALWTASVSIADEIEGRTALTLLSKPVGRRQFVFGKFLGIVGAVVVLFIILGAVFLGATAYKVVYDAREGALSAPTAEQCWRAVQQIMPGLYLTFLEAVVLTAISVAISTRLTILANLSICATIFALGHLVPMLQQSSVGRHPLVAFMGTLFATVLPVLDYFSVEAAIYNNASVPLSYLAATTGYALLYTTIAMLLALVLFEDRDLA